MYNKKWKDDGLQQQRQHKSRFLEAPLVRCRTASLKKSKKLRLPCLQVLKLILKLI